MKNAAVGLTALAGVLNEFASKGLAHPMLAGAGGIVAGGGALYGAGRLAWQIQNGFGLGKSAVALDAAAAHLMEVGGGGGIGGKVASAAEGAAAGAGTGALGEGGAALAIPEVATVATAAMGILGAAAVTQLVKSSFEAQQAGKGGQWAAPTPATEDLDRLRLADQKAEAADLENQITRERARSKLPPGEESPNILNWQTQLDTKRVQIAKLESGLDGLTAYHDREAERGRGLMALRGPEMFGPNLPAGAALRTEAFGPGMMPMELDDRATRARANDNFRFFPGSGGPVPVVIANAPPAFHDGWLDGERPAIEHQSALSADHFKRDFEGARGDSMLEHFGSSLDEAHTKLDQLGSATVTPKVNPASIDAYIAKLEQALGMQSRLSGVPSIGSTGSTGPSRVVASMGVGKSR